MILALSLSGWSYAIGAIFAAIGGWFAWRNSPWRQSRVEKEEKEEARSDIDDAVDNLDLDEIRKISRRNK